MLSAKVNKVGGLHKHKNEYSFIVIQILQHIIPYKMKMITIISIVAVAVAAPISSNIVNYPVDKDESERVVCSSWMLKTSENTKLKISDSTFKPNVEYSTSSLVGENGKFTITNTDEIFYMQDFYNMMNYGDNKFIFWSINGSIKFYNCIKQNDIKPKLTNETYITLDEKNSIDVRGCMNNVDCINVHCQDMVYVQDTLSCYPTKTGKVLGYYISQDKNW